MITDHAAVAIAQTVFYVPAVPLTLYICIRNWATGPRKAWYPLVAFCLVRLVGGIIVIVQSYNADDLGLIIASIVLLNIGLIPLIVSTLFLVRFVFASSFPHDSLNRRVGVGIRFALFVAVGLLIASGSLVGQSSLAATQIALSKAAYVVFAAIVLALLGMLIVLFNRRSQLATHDFTYVKFSLLTMPAIILRAIYGLLYVFTSSSIFSTWNPLFGSAVAFALMALLPEYIALVLYSYLGFYRIRTCRQNSNNSESSELRELRK